MWWGQEHNFLDSCDPRLNRWLRWDTVNDNDDIDPIHRIEEEWLDKDVSTVTRHAFCHFFQDARPVPADGTMDDLGVLSEVEFERRNEVAGSYWSITSVLDSEEV